jgi:hypothetical protein
MRIQSIWTPVEIRDPTRNRLLVAPSQMTFRKMNCVAKPHHLAEKVGTMAKAFENARHSLPAGFASPLIVDNGHIAGCIRVFNELNLGV